MLRANRPPFPARTFRPGRTRPWPRRPVPGRRAPRQRFRHCGSFGWWSGGESTPPSPLPRGVRCGSPPWGGLRGSPDGRGRQARAPAGRVLDGLGQGWRPRGPIIVAGGRDLDCRRGPERVDGRVRLGAPDALAATPGRAAAPRATRAVEHPEQRVLALPGILGQRRQVGRSRAQPIIMRLALPPAAVVLVLNTRSRTSHSRG